MNAFHLSFKTDNAAFDGKHRFEIARILRETANRIEEADPVGQRRLIRDYNGNHIGSFYTEE